MDQLRLLTPDIGLTSKRNGDDSLIEDRCIVFFVVLDDGHHEGDELVPIR